MRFGYLAAALQTDKSIGGDKMKKWLLNVTLMAAAILITDLARAESASCSYFSNPVLLLKPQYFWMTYSIQNNTIENRKACVESIYQSVLNRSADPGGLEYWQSVLNGAMALTNRPASIRNAIAQSEEATALINSAYVSLLGRSADPGGLEYWRQILVQHGYSAVVGGLMASDEYRIRMGL